MALLSSMMSQINGCVLCCSILCNLKAPDYLMFILCLLTAFIWGITNWFLKQGSTGLQKIHYDNRIKQFGAEIWYFFTNAKVIIVFKFKTVFVILYN